MSFGWLEAVPKKLTGTKKRPSPVKDKPRRVGRTGGVLQRRKVLHIA
jgi:hypothetical protein